MPNSKSTTASNVEDESVQSSTDKSLLRRFRDGNQDAATALYVRYAKRLQALAKAQTGEQLASRFDPEDVVQSVFRTFFRRAVETGYDVPAGDELWQLLLVMALNKIRTLATHHRAQKRDVARTGRPEHFEQLCQGPSGQDELAYETMRIVVEELVAELPAPKNRIVELRIEGHEVQEIAKETNRSMRTVERTLQQFRSRLAKLIDDEV
jgi:RNA polymerase sigma-70 factor (ECF subfamily)